MEDPIDSYSFDCRLIAPNIGVNKGFSLGRVPQIVGAGYHVIGFTHDVEFFNPYIQTTQEVEDVQGELDFGVMLGGGLAITKQIGFNSGLL